MTDKQWSLFFSLLGDIVDSDAPWEEKKEIVEKAAKEHGGDGDLDEFVSWFDS